MRTLDGGGSGMSERDMLQLAKMDSREMQATMRRPTVTESLKQEKMALETRLAMVDEALAALERTPQITEVLDLLAKVGVRP